MKKKMVRLLAVCLTTALLTAGLLALRANRLTPTEPSLIPPLDAQVAVTTPPSLPPSKPVKPPAPPPLTATLRLTAAGDNLIHDNIYRQAAVRTGGAGYDFSPVYENMACLIEGSDIAFVNQETVIAEGLYPLAGYPRFNSPKAAGYQLTAMGFNVINLSNNHMLDKNEDGLMATLDFWAAQAGILTVGVFKDENAMQTPVVFESVNGVRVAFVGVTEHTNDLFLPQGSPLRYLLSSDLAAIRQQVSLARAAGDFVVLSIHWGLENVLLPDENQQRLVELFAEWGVDVVLGHHPHTLQPMQWLPRKGGGETLVVYSLGNLVSSMTHPQNMLGGVLDIDITKDLVSGVTEISRAHLHPIVTHYEGAGRLNVRVYPLADYTEELAKSHGIAQTAPNFGLAYMENIIKTNILQEFLPGLPSKTP